jgi:predicted O-linked N-acetylglucosamine transferase (SPINDLY family)
VNIFNILNEGLVCHNEGNLAQAENCYQQILKSKPDHEEALHFLGVIAYQQGDLDRAEKIVRQALDIDPNYAYAYNHLGLILEGLGRDKEALAAYEQAIQLNSSQEELHINLVNLLKKHFSQNEIIAAFNRYLELIPKSAQGHYLYGCYLRSLDKDQDALIHLKKAVELDPNKEEYANDLGSIYGDFEEHEKAVYCFRQALLVNPDFHAARSNLAFWQRMICDWQGLSEVNQRIATETRRSLENGDVPLESPFVVLSRNWQPENIYTINRAWSNHVSEKISESKPNFRYPSKSDCLVIGYLANNFHNHPLTHLLLGILRCHDREKFQINIYSYGGENNSEYRKKVIELSDFFIDLSQETDFKASEKINQDGVQILIDLTGHLRKARLAISAYRPAPVQIRYMGFPGTTGSDFFDYLMADPIVAPPEQSTFYSEALVYLPGSYQINDNTQTMSHKGFNRYDCSLPSEGTVFCSFNTAYKITPEIFSCWMQILQQIPGSVLWLKDSGQAMRKNLQKEADKAGISPNRLIFAPPITRPVHLRRIQLADLVLDTFPVSGAASTSDALWAGVPVLTCSGESFPCCMSSSLLQAAGLSDLVVNNFDDYVDKAVAISQDKELLQEIRAKVRRARTKSLLFNTEAKTRAIEQAYQEMWARYCQGEAPCSFEVGSQKEFIEDQAEINSRDKSQEYFQRAVELHQQGDLEQAKTLYECALAHNPDHDQSLHLSGLLAWQQGNIEKGAELIRYALAKNPANQEAAGNLALIEAHRGQKQEALSIFRQALARGSAETESFIKLAKVFNIAGQSKEVQLAQNSVHALQVRDNEACFEQALKWRKKGESGIAASLLQKALELEPCSARYLNAFGLILRDLGRQEEALKAFETALDYSPNYVEALNNTSLVFMDQNRASLALEFLDRAMEIASDNFEIQINRGHVLFEKGNMEEAWECFRHANTQGQTQSALPSLYYLSRLLCVWNDIKNIERKLQQQTRQELQAGYLPLEVPFISLIREEDLQTRLSLAKAWSQKIMPKDSLENTPPYGFVSQSEKMTIGYLANNFHNHPLTHLLLGLLKHHNRERFKILLFSYGLNDGSEERKELITLCDEFVDLWNVHNDQTAAQEIMKRKVNILVDLVGHLQRNRLGISALRPAPIQVRYLGFPGTTGSDFFDYLLTDHRVTPPEVAHCYSEKFIYLPGSYQVNNNSRPDNKDLLLRKDYSLPIDSCVYCSFNTSYKLEPEMFAVWMAILQQVPGSILWLLNSGQKQCKNLQAEAESLGISSDRLIFAPRLPRHEHLARLAQADLALDTYRVNGAASTTDALLVGVPVLTCQGEDFTSRMSASLLQAAGLSDMITSDFETYKKMAVELGNNPEKRQDLRKSVQSAREKSSLFDTASKTRAIEQTYLEMWRRYQENLPVESFSVEEFEEVHGLKKFTVHSSQLRIKN